MLGRFAKLGFCHKFYVEHCSLNASISILEKSWFGPNLGVLFFHLFDFLLNLSKIIRVFISNIFFVLVVNHCLLMSYHALCEYRDLKDIRCIVFVERVITAVVLHNLLSELLPKYNSWKSKYIAGNNSGLQSQTRKKQNEIVEEFRNGMVCSLPPLSFTRMCFVTNVHVWLSVKCVYRWTSLLQHQFLKRV